MAAKVLHELHFLPVSRSTPKDTTPKDPSPEDDAPSALARFRAPNPGWVQTEASADSVPHETLFWRMSVYLGVVCPCGGDNRHEPPAKHNPRDVGCATDWGLKGSMICSHSIVSPETPSSMQRFRIINGIYWASTAVDSLVRRSAEAPSCSLVGRLLRAKRPLPPSPPLLERLPLMKNLDLTHVLTRESARETQGFWTAGFPARSRWIRCVLLLQCALL
jgi:hypothetical protein